MILAAEEDHARPITRLALRFLALTAVRPSELRGALWAEFEDLDGKLPLWRIPTARMKGDLDRKEELKGDHLVPITPQALAVLGALWPLTGSGDLLFPSNRHTHRPMSENAIGYLLNRAGYHGRHVPHGFRAAFSTIISVSVTSCAVMVSLIPVLGEVGEDQSTSQREHRSMTTTTYSQPSAVQPKVRSTIHL